YDGLATAAGRLRARTELTFESRTFQHGSPQTLAALVEVVAAGSVGASVVLVSESDRSTALTESLADEWVSHLVTDRAGLDTLDPTVLEDLRAVVLDNGVGAGAPGSWARVDSIVEFAELLGTD
ncbi:hypothetical protein AB4305_34875, partial [Nocardia sp. 2YAB30]|uniref:hypothetical protein n=1 Tax=Nocardia sp. 2YAB30 TaxID=3233022 RepID=UPI003F9CDD1C